MNFYDPRQSYRSGLNGESTRQSVEMNLDSHDFSGASEFMSMCVVLKASVVREILQEHPEYFADAPAQSVDEMDEQARSEHARLVEQLKNPESYPSKFAVWLDESRATQFS